ADLIARITSQTSGPPARAPRRPVGPSRNTTPGCSVVRNPSSTSRLAAADNERPGWDAANELRRRATSGSNLTGIGDLRAINYSVVDGARSVDGYARSLPRSRRDPLPQLPQQIAAALVDADLV